MDYWHECIVEALEDSGIEATKEQIENIVAWVQGAHDNYGTAHGYDVIGNYAESNAERELSILRRNIEKQENWVYSTEPCRSCMTTGSVKDGWGRWTECRSCNGKGRV